jgi:uncharacterized Ntn-hydrolase superfamily protein
MPVEPAIVAKDELIEVGVDVLAAQAVIRTQRPAGEPTVAATLAAWQAHPELDIPERLVAAGEAAGGDRRGGQSAAMVLTTTEDFPDLDLRVDDSADPLPELRRLLGIWRRERAPGLTTQPSRANPSGFTDLDAIEAGWIARGLDLRFRR